LTIDLISTILHFINNPKNKTLISQAITAPKKKRVSAPISKLLKRIIGEDTQLFRGFRLGQDLNEILAAEKLKLFEKEKEYFGFTFDTSNFETVDVLYFKDVFNRLSKIQVDVFMNSDETNLELFDALHYFFYEKYGFPTPLQDGYKWSIDPDVTLKFTKVKNQVERGLLIIFDK
jgi:hypothetical protein